MIDEWIEVALRIGRTLARTAIWNGTRCGWLTEALESDRGMTVLTLRATGPEVYGGTSGIALFLAHLRLVTSDRAVADAAHGALASALSLADEMRDGWSFYTGRVGVACAAVECGELLTEPAYVRRGLHLLRSEAPPEEHMRLDAATGMAGCIAPFLRLWRRYGEQWLLDRALSCGRILMAAVHRTEAGASWPSLSAARQEAIGYAHGNSGTALALLQLSRAAGSEEMRIVAEEAFRYERNVLRTMLDTDTTWCHGAAGIGLSRLVALRNGDDPAWREDAERALLTVAAALTPAQPARDFSLCHGLSGAMELFLAAAERDETHRERAGTIALIGVEEHHRRGLRWPIGVRGGTHAPGLILGLAGIGYTYLRLAMPEIVPSLLAIPDEEAADTHYVS